MHACFGSEAGKRVLRHLMTNFHFFESILPGVGLEYYEGQRSVLCHILGSMQADFSDPETMLQVALNASFDYSQYQPKEAQ